MPSVSDVVGFLDKEEALELDTPPEVWPRVSDDDQLFELDWARLFPGRVTDRGQLDWDLYAADDWRIPPELERALFDPSAEVGAPGWDRCAWYQPIHFYGYGWGIFIYEDCVVAAMRGVLSHLGGGGGGGGPNFLKALLRSAFATLFLHEQFHHKTESLGIRLHVVERSPRYAPYFRNVYIPTGGSDDQLEEGLANADSFHRLSDEPYRTWLGRSLLHATRDYLRSSFLTAPPGYRLASGLLDVASFDRSENVFEAQVQEATVHPKQNANDWALATHANQSLFNVRQNIWTVVRRGAAPIFPVKPGTTAPVSARQLDRYLRGEGFSHQASRGKGSHAVYRRDGAPLVVVPNSGDLSPVVLRNTAHALGLKNVHKLEQLVRSA